MNVLTTIHVAGNATMPNSVIPFPLDRKRLMTFRIGGRTYPLIIPIPSAVRRERGRVIPIFGQTPGQEAERGRDSLRGIGNQRVGRRQIELAYAAEWSDECPDHAARGRRNNMKRFVIDREFNVTALDSLAEGKPNTQPEGREFSTLDEWGEMTRDWPLTRLVAVWNGLPGLRAVRKFTDRKTAVTRIWKALNGAPGSQASRAASAKGRGGKRRQPLARGGTKKARILSLLRQRSGATLQDL